jgi:hypothetical protein
VDLRLWEPPPDPAECEMAPPDPFADADRWPILARTINRNRISRRVLALAAAWADAVERKLIDQLHAEAEAGTDY